jgi:hypothetical protein
MFHWFLGNRTYLPGCESSKNELTTYRFRAKLWFLGVSSVKTPRRAPAIGAGKLGTGSRLENIKGRLVLMLFVWMQSEDRELAELDYAVRTEQCIHPLALNGPRCFLFPFLSLTPDWVCIICMFNIYATVHIVVGIVNMAVTLFCRSYQLLSYHRSFFYGIVYIRSPIEW